MAKNRAIEFHDSRLLSVVREGEDIRLQLTAYVHESDGEPGRDAGSGWTQDVEFILTDVVVAMLPQEEAWTLADGWVRIEGRRFDGTLPLPFAHAGALEFEIQGDDRRLTVTAGGLQIVARGAARFVEDFPGTR